MFAGGCTLEAAEDVTDADLDALQSLVEKSLLRSTNERFWMLETIREYGEERAVESGEREELGRRHRAWFVQLAGESGMDIRAPDANKLLSSKSGAATAVTADFTNIRQAVANGLSSHEPGDVGRIVAPLWPFLIVHGHAAEAREWVVSALAQRRFLSKSGLAATLLGGGEILRFAGDLPGAAALKMEALGLIPEVREFEGWIPFVLADLCDIALANGDLARAREYAERSAAAGGGARAAGSLAYVCLQAGDLESAEAHALVSLGGFEEGELNHAATLEILGEVALRSGDHAKAHRLFSDAARSYSDLADGGGIADCLDGLSRLAAKAGDLVRAGVLHGAVNIYALPPAAAFRHNPTLSGPIFQRTPGQGALQWSFRMPLSTPWPP